MDFLFLIIMIALGRHENNLLMISSTAFQNNGLMPAVYTCDGENFNPPLDISNIPAKAKSIAIIVNDPDAPNGGFIHWVDYNIPVNGSTLSIPANSENGVAGKNGTGKDGYTGPCPPSGTHHYHFKVFALDGPVPVQGGMDAKTLEQSISGHIISSGELVGLYVRSTK